MAEKRPFQPAGDNPFAIGRFAPSSLAGMLFRVVHRSAAINYRKEDIGNYL